MWDISFKTSITLREKVTKRKERKKRKKALYVAMRLLEIESQKRSKRKQARRNEIPLKSRSIEHLPLPQSQ